MSFISQIIQQIIFMKEKSNKIVNYINYTILQFSLLKKLLPDLLLLYLIFITLSKLFLNDLY